MTGFPELAAGALSDAAAPLRSGHHARPTNLGSVYGASGLRQNPIERA
jgi:hypothetical protein